LYDWLHLHHEDFQGNIVNFMQLTKMPWYIEQKKSLRLWQINWFYKVAEKKVLCQKIRDFVIGGGFMFAMCSATDSFDIALCRWC
jgi:hypothetical protein